MQTPADTYLPDTAYHALKNALAHMVAQPFDAEGTDAQTEVVRILGETGGIWPVSVMDDAARDAAA